ncbi:hypothetical protein TIFTF001_045893 [Ficus carica]|uniref:Uncharacterized protein n=1 Tax=Ficus carica TaxID=3494 RepID=A0AA87Z3C2_FICCA|nr:hypothetical protein TIFTF001_045893 [Ficus carica]
MSFNEQEGTCSCTLRRSSITQDIAREVSTTTAYSIGFVVVLAQEVVLAERKLTVLRLCCRRVVTELVSERFPAIRFHSLPAIATIILWFFYGSRPLLYDGTGRSVTVSAWLYDMEMIFYTCHIEDRSQVSLASRCLITDARLWWMTYGEQQMPSRTWAHFRVVVLAQYGPIPMGGPDDDGQYRDPEIYQDMHYRRYQSFIADWYAYPQESTGHYCCRFQEVILPYIPQDMPHPQLQALVILRNGVPPRIRRFVKEPTIERTVGDMMDDILQVEVTAHMAQADAFMNEHQVPVDDVGIGGPQHEVGPMFLEDPIPAMPVQEILAQEAEDQMDAEGPADDLIAPVDPPEDPPVIIIPSDDEDEEDDMEPEVEQGDWVEDIDDAEGDPEEIRFHNEDWDEDSDADSDISMITLEVIV